MRYTRNGSEYNFIKFAIFILAFSTSCSVYADPSKCTKTWDDFSAGFNVASPTDTQVNPLNKWFYFNTGPIFIGDDGKATVKGKTLTIASKTNNPTTGEPQFTKYLAPEGLNNNPFSLPGGLDHVKFLVYMNHNSDISGGNVPGFSAPAKGAVMCQANFQGQTYGTASNPFGVEDANDDLRLAGSAMNVIDFQTYMVFDMFVSNKKVYAFYERLPFGRGQTGFSSNYAAFSYAIPVADRKPADMNELKVAYDKNKGIVTWYLDGKKVYQVDKLGFKLENQNKIFHSKYSNTHPPIMLLDHGGTEELISPNQIDCGMGMFTLLDGHVGNGPGLVKLSNTPGMYIPDSFIKSASTDAEFNVNNYLFGQGASLSLMQYKVTSPDICPMKDKDDDDDDDEDNQS